MNAADILKYGHLTVLQTIDGSPNRPGKLVARVAYGLSKISSPT